ncbi:3-hydroxyisobutyrate dehydrogenase [Calothrix sp. HK-06]|nr:3-hydroxyisobutyrate dehydrogenase [Calothrix sp. HK-06]
MSQVAVLGIGAMGSRMVENLLNANHQVVVYNRTEDKVKPLQKLGAVYAATPREAAEQADIIISMVTDSNASRAIWLNQETGAILGLRKDAIAIESSTLTVSWVKELASLLSSRGVAFLDAPVIGSRPQADARKLIYIVGGQIETLKQAEHILLSAGGLVIHHVGDIGQGMAMKLAVNALFGIQVAALAEVMGMLTKNGLKLEKAIQCLSELPVMSLAAKNAANLIMAENHTPMFPIDLVEKDFRYVMQSAQEVDALTPVSTAIHNVYLDAIKLGYGGNNITGVARLFI